ncbi:TerD family protein [Moraxella canis]|uniref:TerD domain-containing protein n=1 Tax=Moraxella canis TaxID=90239 RepID=A0A1S9ZPX9_9GAMM|nr:TerD family protein [Moraxella canis]OOR85400.1 hypothetical protein B0180_00965 [Moraxella canis]
MSRKTHVLKEYFDPVKLSEHQLDGTLIAGVSYHFTSLEKQGLAALLAKLPLADDAPVAMDLDLSCFVYDKGFNVIDVIWYGNLRNADESIRHQGDALVGAKSFEDSLIQQEQIQIKLDQLPDTAHHLIFVLSSYHNQPLRKAQKGMIYFGDKELPKAYHISFDQIEPDCQSLAIWQLSRYRGDWELSSPMADIKLTKLSNKSLDKITDAVTTRIQAVQSKRW